VICELRRLSRTAQPQRGQTGAMSVATQNEVPPICAHDGIERRSTGCNACPSPRVASAVVSDGSPPTGIADVQHTRLYLGRSGSESSSSRKRVASRTDR
jgi:hypothetical protein